MPSFSEIKWVRSGMEVRSSDGISLGRVAEVWCGNDPRNSAEECDERFCTRIEVHSSLPSKMGGIGGWLRRNKPYSNGPALFIPCSVIDSIPGKSVTLTVDAATAQAWTRMPGWIEGAGGRRDSRTASTMDPGGDLIDAQLKDIASQESRARYT